MSNEENKLRVSPCSQCLRVFLQNHPKKEPKIARFSQLKNLKKPVSSSQKGISSSQKGVSSWLPRKRENVGLSLRLVKDVNEILWL